MEYEDLLNEADKRGLKVKEIHLNGNDGRIYKNRIAIRKNISSIREKACVLSEEIAHYDFNFGDIMNESEILCRKQEYTARFISFNRQVGLLGLIRAYENGCQSLYEVADFLNVPEQYLMDAIKCYSEKYSPFIEVDNYIIYFIPTLIISKFLE